MGCTSGESTESGSSKTSSEKAVSDTVELNSVRVTDTIATSHNTVKIKSKCSHENETSSLGIGLLINDSTNTEHLELFDDHRLTKLFQRIHIYSERSSVCGKFQDPEYGILQFICLETSNTAYKILVNNSEVKYVSTKGSGYEFRSWKDYILTALSVRRKEGYRTEHIFEVPHDSSDVIQLPQERFESFCALDVWEDWIEVQYDCFYNNPGNSEFLPCSESIDKCELPSGWIKWRSGDQLLVELPQLL